MVQFNFTYTPGISPQQIVGVEMAGEIWSTFLTDPIEIDVHIEAIDLVEEPNLLGGTLPGVDTKVKYKETHQALEADVSSADDATAFANLRTEKNGKANKFKAHLYNESLYGNEMSLSRANAKAIGELANGSSADNLDGVIVFNTLESNADADWYYRHEGGAIASDEVDFVSVAVHEIGHILGFFSGIDQPGWQDTLLRSTDIELDDGELEIELEEGGAVRDKLNFVTTLDLFRYSNTSRSHDAIDMSIGGDPYFSIDGGATRLADFATGQGDTALGGDGYQASHWEANSDDGIMDPVVRLQEQPEITDVDLKALDVIGYDIDSNASLDFAAIEAQALINSQEDGIVVVRDDDITEMIEDSKVYEQWGWGSGSGYGQWGWGGGSGYGQWGWGSGSGYGANLIVDSGFFAMLDLSDAAGDESSDATDAGEAAADASGAGNAETAVPVGPAPDSLLGLARDFLAEDELHTQVVEDFLARTEREPSVEYLEGLGNRLGLLGSDTAVLGELFGYAILDGMLGELFPAATGTAGSGLLAANPTSGTEG